MNLNIYNPANKRKESLIEEFVVRKKEFQTIANDIKTYDNKYPPQHYLIIGQRGAGKTTLIQRLIYFIEDEPDLIKQNFPITLDEEQYGISELSNLWERIAEILEDYYHLDNIYSEVIKEIKSTNYEEKAFKTLLDRLEKEDKNIVLFIDNFGDILNKFSEKEIRKLREILMTCSRIRLIAATPILLEHILDYQNPLFEFFTTIHLKGLNSEDIKSLLIKLSELNGSSKKIDSILKKQSDRIEILRQFTGGVTRTVVLLYNIFMESENGNAFRDLQLTLDALTPLYKHKMDDLKKHQQKIVDAVAKSWDATDVKGIVESTRIESKIVSAQLRQLEKNQIIEKISTSKKNHLYQIKERFFNIWYLMRYGRRDDRYRVIWLVRFLESWYSREELEYRIKSHLDGLQAGLFEVDTALLLGEAYLFCDEISPSLKSKLIERTIEKFPKAKIENRNLVYLQVYNKSVEEFNDGRYQEAIDTLKNIPDEDKNEIVGELLMDLYVILDDYENCVKEGLLLINQGIENKNIFYTIGYSYRVLEDFEKAILYLTKAVNNGVIMANVDLGMIYVRKKEYNKAEKYFKEGLKNKDSKSGAAHFLAHLYEDMQNFKKAEKYYLQAIDNNEERVNFCLANLYHKNNELEKAAKYYEKSLESEEESLIGYGLLKIQLGEEKEGRLLLKRASKINNTNMNYLLGRVYDFELDEPENAIKFYKKAIKEGVVTAEHRIAHMYSEVLDFENAEKYFLSYIEKSKNNNALLCLVNLYKKFNRNKEKASAVIKKAKKNVDFNIYDDILYAEILLWNDDLEVSEKLIEKLIKKTPKTILTEDLDIITSLTSYFIRLLAKEHYNTSLKLISMKELNEILKPIYYALMHYMKNEFPDEKLRMGAELKEIVESVIIKIEAQKKSVK